MQKLNFSSVISLAFLLTNALLTACSSGPKIPAEVAEIRNRPGLKTVVILGLNDIHGALATQDAKTHEAPGTSPIAYEKGGAAQLAGYIKELRSEFGPELLVLDAGDEFQGSIESNLEQGAPMVKYFNAIGLNAAAVGNHEFDFGVPALNARMVESHYPWLSANLVDKTTDSLPAYPNTYPHVILNAGGLKVGVIGLTTLETPTSTRADAVKGLKFESLKETTIREAAEVKKEGAEIVVLLAHVGLKCGDGHAPTGYAVRKPGDPEGGCGEKDEMVKLLEDLPPGTVDAVVSGHSHQLIHHWVNDVPVIQSGTRANQFNLLYLTFDTTEKKLLTDKTRIEGPIPVCPKVFEHQQDCNGERPAPKHGRGSLITPVFHGRKIYPDSAIETLLEPTFKKSEAEKKRVVGQAVRPLIHDRTKESELGNLIADAMRWKTHADVALVNAGGIRSNLEQGPITYESVFRILPFDNSIAVMNVSGKELKTILRVGENASRGFFPVSGVKLRLLELGADTPSTDLNHDHKIEPWEIDRLLEARFSDDSKISDTKHYRLATLDFLVNGGDDMGWAMKQVSASQVQMTAGGVLRDTVLEYLAQSGPVNSPSHPLIDPAHPRMKLEKVATKKSGKGKGKRRRRAKKRK